MNLYIIKEKWEDKILKTKNVRGISIGNKITKGIDTGKKCIRIYVKKKIELHLLSVSDLLPQSLDTIETDVIEVGEIVALGYKEKIRPAPGGVSIGHYKVSAGTLGCLVIDNKTDEVLILSNNHVLANSNKAKLGDKIIQPGVYDGGSIDKDVIAYLTRYIKIISKNWTCWKPTPKNLVDCAVAKPIDENLVVSEIIKIGTPIGVVFPKEGMSLQKSGRTTEYTQGKITDIDATISVNYGDFVAVFKHQIITTAMSAGGDSGSLVLDDNKQAVGLLFAGSDKITILNPIHEVLSQLEVELVL